MVDALAVELAPVNVGTAATELSLLVEAVKVESDPVVEVVLLARSEPDADAVELVNGVDELANVLVGTTTGVKDVGIVVLVIAVMSLAGVAVASGVCVELDDTTVELLLGVLVIVTGAAESEVAAAVLLDNADVSEDVNPVEVAFTASVPCVDSVVVLSVEVVTREVAVADTSLAALVAGVVSTDEVVPMSAAVVFEYGAVEGVDEFENGAREGNLRSSWPL